MTDLELLSHPDWQRLTNRQLRRAITLAKLRARKTFPLMVAWSEEQQERLPAASTTLYTRHCILVGPRGQSLKEEWDDLRIIDWCQDPRVYSFCHLYDRLYRRHQGMNPLPKDRLVLQARANHAYAQVSRLKVAFTFQQWVMPCSSPADRIRMEEQIEANQKQFNAALDYSMLTLMQLNAHMDEFVSGGRSR